MRKFTLLLFILLLPLKSLADDFEIITGIYGWVPAIYGELKFSTDGDGADEPTTPVEPKEVSYSLNGLFMGNIEIRKNKFVFYTDIAYVDISQSGEREKLLDSTNPDYTIGISGWQSSYLAGYNLIKTKNLSLDILGGLRYFSLEVSLDFYIGDRAVSISPYKGLLDGIIATRGIYSLDNHWFLPFHLDAGAGKSKSTYQIMGGIGYGSSWGDISLVYKHIAWNQDSEMIVNNITLTGTSIGYAYHF